MLIASGSQNRRGSSVARIKWSSECKGKSMRCTRLQVAGAAAMAVLSWGAFSQQPPDRTEAGVSAKGLPLGQIRPMTVAFAMRLVAAAKKATCAPPAGTCSGAFAVVDDAGVLVYLETIDGVQAGGPELAIRKAKTSAEWRRPTKTFLDAVDNKTNTSYADGTFPDMTTSAWRRADIQGRQESLVDLAPQQPEATLPTSRLRTRYWQKPCKSSGSSN